MTQKKYLSLLIITILAALSLTSCGDEYYDYSPIEGRWTLVSVNGVPVADEYYVEEYEFRSNGTGFYGYYTSYGWTEDRITWELLDDNYGTLLYIYYRTSTRIYEISLKREFGDDYLYLTDTATGNVFVYADASNW